MHWPGRAPGPCTWVEPFRALRGLERLACDRLRQYLDESGNDLSPLVSLTLWNGFGDDPVAGGFDVLTRLTNLKQLLLRAPGSPFVVKPTGRELNLLAMPRLTSVSVIPERVCRGSLVSLFKSLPALRCLQLYGAPFDHVPSVSVWGSWTAPLQDLDLWCLPIAYTILILGSLTAPSLDHLTLSDAFAVWSLEQTGRVGTLLSGPHRASHFPSLAQVKVGFYRPKADATPLRVVAGLTVLRA